MKTISMEIILGFRLIMYVFHTSVILRSCAINFIIPFLKAFFCKKCQEVKCVFTSHLSLHCFSGCWLG